MKLSDNVEHVKDKETGLLLFSDLKYHCGITLTIEELANIPQVKALIEALEMMGKELCDSCGEKCTIVCNEIKQCEDALAPFKMSTVDKDGCECLNHWH